MSLVGGCSSGDGEPDDLEADVEECAERRFERLGSFRSLGGAMSSSSVVVAVVGGGSASAYRRRRILTFGV